MLEDEDWKSLIPKSVTNVINEIDGINRLHELSKKEINER